MPIDISWQPVRKMDVKGGRGGGENVKPRHRNQVSKMKRPKTCRCVLCRRNSGHMRKISIIIIIIIISSNSYKSWIAGKSSLIDALRLNTE